VRIEGGGGEKSREGGGEIWGCGRAGGGRRTGGEELGIGASHLCREGAKVPYIVTRNVQEIRSLCKKQGGPAS